MANVVKIKQSAVASSVPTTAQLVLGELAINTTDGKLYLKKSVLGVESIIEIGQLNNTALTGIPTAPTAAAATNTTQLATTAHVFAERSNTATLTNKTLTSPLISQIVFPATQSASNDPNTLDDYEEGTWDAIVTTDGVTFDSITYQFRQCKYIKIGRLVFVYGLIRTSACTIGSATGSVKVSGLPFTSVNIDAGYYRAAISCVTSNIGAAFRYQAMQLEPNSNYMYPFALDGSLCAASAVGTGASGFNSVIGGCYMASS